LPALRPVCLARRLTPIRRLRDISRFAHGEPVSCASLFDLADKAKPLARQRAEEALPLAVVADSVAHRVDLAAEGGFRHDAAGPYRGEEVILADHALAILNEIEQEIEGLRLGGDQRRPAPQFPAVRIEQILFKSVDHSKSRQGLPLRKIKPANSQGKAKHTPKTHACPSDYRKRLPTRRRPMDALLTAIVIWISANYPLPASLDHPRIERVASVEMAGLRYKGLLSAPARQTTALQEQESSFEKRRDVVALYNDQTRTIYLSDKWAGATPAELSVLVHEMVHHLQNQAGTAYECPAEREKLAYEAQDKWLHLFGRNLEQEFEINGLALLVSTSCAMAMGLY
jgi:hypothetical protein